jgi:hypothetical protein
VFSVYYVLSLLVMIPLVVSGIAKKDPQIVLCIFIFDVFVTALIAFLNFDLLMYVRKDAARLKKEQASWTS